jgi:type I restriction enzyme M protein
MEDGDEVFVDKMQKLTQKLGGQITEGVEFYALLQQKLEEFFYDF